MTDAAPFHPFPPELQAWFEIWKSCLQDVLSQASGQPAIFEIVFEPLPPADSDLRYTITAGGAVQGEMALRLSSLSALRLTRKFLGEPDLPPAETVTPESLTDENRDALEELLRQIAGLASTSAGASAGAPVQFVLSPAEAAWAWTSDAVATLRRRDEGGAEMAVEIRVSPALAAALATRVPAAAASSPAPAASTLPAAAARASEQHPSAAAAAAAGAATPASDQHSPITAVAAAPASSSAPAPAATVSPATGTPDEQAANYRRVLDVGLGVKLRFGTRRMLLRDVLALSSGLVVELDNQLNSPVDLLLDGRVIARGDVVVIDGKYGLRVSEVVDSAPPAAPA